MDRYMYKSLFLYFLLLESLFAAPSGLLNDSGQQRCIDNSGAVLEACATVNSGDGSNYPGQDGRYGRDAAISNPARSGLSKPEGSGGTGGFALVPLDVQGQPIPLTGSPQIPAAIPRCIWDRVTNLIWEVKTTDWGLQDWRWTYAWGSAPSSICTLGTDMCNTDNYIAALNSENPCPVSSSGQWRLPTLREMLSIINHGASVGPSIDGDYFPNTGQVYYWTSDEVFPPNGAVWYLSLFSGLTGAYDSSVTNYVRLVRDGP